MAANNSRVQISIAILGLIGIVLAATISNWDKLFKPPSQLPKDDKPTISSPNISNVKGNVSINMPTNTQTTAGDCSPAIITTNNVEVNCNIKILPTDPPDIKQKKIEKAKRLIGNEVLFNVTNLDARLGFIEQLLLLNNSDDFEEQFRKVRQQVAPAIETIAKVGYGNLISQEQATNLRAVFNSYPLRLDLEAPLIQVLADSNINTNLLNSFYQSLHEAQYQSESYIEAMANVAQTTTEDENVIAYKKKELLLKKNTLINRFELAYVSAHIVLNGLEIPISEFNDKIVSLKYLKPNKLLNNSELLKKEQELLTESHKLLSEKKNLIDEKKKTLEAILEKYKNVNELLEIQTSDTWNQVIGKARALRKLGRTTEAAAAFSRYGEMFSDKDPTAKQYANEAQLFTIQLPKLKIDGGVYIYEVSKNSIAEKSKLKVGDIIVNYNGKNISEMDDLITALRDYQKGTLVTITFLRLDVNGNFITETKTVVGGMIGIGFKPI